MVLVFADAAGTAVEGFASGTRGVNTGVAGLSSVVVIVAGGGVETPVRASWARTGRVTKTRAAVATDSFMACMSSIAVKQLQGLLFRQAIKEKVRANRRPSETNLAKGNRPCYSRAHPLNSSFSVIHIPFSGL